MGDVTQNGASAPAAPLVEAVGVTRVYRSGAGADVVETPALRGVDAQVWPGEVVALRGRSGSGKTTLLNVLVGLDTPTSGRVVAFGRDLGRLGETERARLRRERIGILFQSAHLFPALTALENVEVPLRLARADPRQRGAEAARALALVGLAARAPHRGAELSGGEQQRVALARALAHHPRLLVADEPTGHLDSTTGREIIALLSELAHREGIGMLIATHDPSVMAVADRVLRIEDGRVAEERVERLV